MALITWSSVSITLLLMVVIRLFFYTRHFLRWRSIINKMPGPQGNLLFGVALKFYTSREKQFKVGNALTIPFVGKFPLIRAWTGPFPMVFLITAEATKVLLNSTKQIDKASFYRYLYDWIGTGLLTSTGSKWHHRRKFITPSFHFQILESFLLVMNEQANIIVKLLKEKCEKDKTNQWFDIYPYITRCTLDIICETAMGQGVQAQLNSDSKYLNAVNNLSEAFNKRSTRPWLAPDWIFHLSPLGRLQKRSLQIVHGFTNKIIKMKRSMLNEKKGEVEIEDDDFEILGRKRRVALLDMLLDNPSLTDDDIREEVDTFMFEGHDTTAVGLAWTLYSIGQHPLVQEKIVQELDEVLGNEVNEISSEHLNQLKYLECVIKESLRLHPPVPMYGRTLNEDTDICGYTIPSGVQVIVSAYWVHRDPKIYPNPEEFDPDRFLVDNKINKDPFTFVPFSAGLRNCIGQKFAMMEEKVVLSQILHNFHVVSEKENGEEPSAAMELVLRPINGIKVKLTPRKKK